MLNKSVILSVALGLLVGGAAWYASKPSAPTSDPSLPKGAPLAEVKVPALSGNEILGETAFNAKCAVCHGKNAAGQNGIAPPLVHAYYKPGHHGDMAFQLAVQNGVTSHHWPFGNMPPVQGLTQGDVKNITAYVRALQVANGIK